MSRIALSIRYNSLDGVRWIVFGIVFGREYSADSALSDAVYLINLD